MKKRWFTVLLAVLLTGIVVFTGCPTEDDGGGSSGLTSPDLPKTWDKETDILVVGSGLTGSLAVLGAVEKGATDVIIIEKRAVWGGSSATAGGGFSNLQASEPEDKPVFMANYKRAMLVPDDFPFPNYEKAYGLFSNARSTIAFMISEGVGFGAESNYSASDDPAPTVPGLELGAYNPRRMYRQATGSGAGMMASLRTIIEAKDEVEIMMSCKMVGIYMSKGSAVGVKAEYNGGTINIKANEIILGTGGFAANPDLFDEWAGDIPGLRNTIHGVVAEAAQGDGIVIAVRDTGAALYNINGKVSIFNDTSGFQFHSSVNSLSGVSGLRTGSANASGSTINKQIVVKTNGDRIGNEDRWGGSAGWNNMIHDIIIAGPSPNWVIYCADTTSSANQTALNLAVTTNDTYAKKADTVAELATAISAPNLAATITAYNAANGTGIMEKRTANYVKFENGPFWAVQVFANNLGSQGGVITNDIGQVINTKGKVIPHLWAGGETSNRELFGQAYVGGASLSMYSTMGRRMGNNAALHN